MAVKTVDPDLSTRAERLTKCMNDFASQIANEPSLGLYGINEHVHVTAPRIRDQEKKLSAVQVRTVVLSMRNMTVMQSGP